MSGSLEDVNLAAVEVGAAPLERDGQVLVRVRTAAPAEHDWPVASEPARPDTVEDAGLVPLVSYHRWGNRGPSTMRVWIAEA